MSLNRDAAVEYARRYWNRVTDDDKFWTTNAVVSLAAMRRSLKAPATDGWDAFFVSNGSLGEDAVFQRVVEGKIEKLPDPIARWDDLDDCTHYVCRCLLKEGIRLTETPRAEELTEAMLKSGKTKALALKTTRMEGQKVVDSGVLKPGDLVSYWTEKKGRYTHTAMFVGNQTGSDDDPGGITCHTVCRFQGKTKAWNGADDDNWFLHEGLSYTLIHFSEDDAAVSSAARRWLQGWWKLGNNFYYVADNGRAFSTRSKPASARQVLLTSVSAGYYFEAGAQIVFVWRQPGGKVQVELWTPPTKAKGAAASIDGFDADLSRVF